MNSGPFSDYFLRILPPNPNSLVGSLSSCYGLPSSTDFTKQCRSHLLLSLFLLNSWDCWYLTWDFSVSIILSHQTLIDPLDTITCFPSCMATSCSGAMVSGSSAPFGHWVWWVLSVASLPVHLGWFRINILSLSIYLLSFTATQWVVVQPQVGIYVASGMVYV